MDFNDFAKFFDVLQIKAPSRLIILEASTLASAHVPPYPPDMPVLLTNVNSEELALHLKHVLLTTYPEQHVVFLVGEGIKREETLG
jgi:hypothetical protein